MIYRDFFIGGDDFIDGIENRQIFCVQVAGLNLRNYQFPGSVLKCVWGGSFSHSCDVEIFHQLEKSDRLAIDASIDEFICLIYTCFTHRRGLQSVAFQGL
jgi:hypothetical protein